MLQPEESPERRLERGRERRRYRLAERPGGEERGGGRRWDHEQRRGGGRCWAARGWRGGQLRPGIALSCSISTSFYATGILKYWNPPLPIKCCGSGPVWVCIILPYPDSSLLEAAHFRSHNEQTINGLRKIAWASIFPLMSPFPCLYSSMPRCLHLHVSISPGLHFSWSPCFWNSANGKRN